jgi:predicted P-loop ATPase
MNIFLLFSLFLWNYGPKTESHKRTCLVLALTFAKECQKDKWRRQDFLKLHCAKTLPTSMPLFLCYDVFESLLYRFVSCYESPSPFQRNPLD